MEIEQNLNSNSSSYDFTSSVRRSILAMRGKELSSETRAKIECLKSSNLSNREIANRLNVSTGTVSKTLKRISELSSYSSRSRSGRPKKTSAQTDRLMYRYARANPMASSTEIHSILPSDTSICASTIRRRLLYKYKLRSYRPAKTCLLSAKNIRDRLAFCRRYRHWTVSDWQRVQFSDESVISQYRSFRPFVRRPKGCRFGFKYTLPQVKNPNKVMIWGAISARGRCGLHVLRKGETVNGEKYLKILKEKLPPFMTIRGTDVFQHDGAPAHTCKLVRRWFLGQRFQLLEGWPGNSADLNPIENVWSVVKQKVGEKKPTSMEALTEAIKSVWVSEISSSYCERLISSMPRRIQQCIQNKGRSTKY